MNGLFRCASLWVRIVKLAVVRRILSVASKAIRRWVRCIRNRSREKIAGTGRREKIEGNIAGGQWGLSLVYKTSAIKFISFAGLVRGQCVS